MLVLVQFRSSSGTHEAVIVQGWPFHLLFFSFPITAFPSPQNVQEKNSFSGKAFSTRKSVLQWEEREQHQQEQINLCQYIHSHKQIWLVCGFSLLVHPFFGISFQVTWCHQRAMGLCAPSLLPTLSVHPPELLPVAGWFPTESGKVEDACVVDIGPSRLTIDKELKHVSQP